MAAAQREDRLSGSGPTVDQRNAFQLDRDRVLYSGAFRRLAGVTQVISPTEGEVFHNRLTHTLKVAQIARRIAEMFAQRQPGEAAEWGGIEPEVVEAAALIHDLGHPPFGHIAEEELHALVKKHGGEGYEGNAQSFRIVSKLAFRGMRSKCGLDLTRATLNASLKYPWLPRDGKYGCYTSEEASLTFARQLDRSGADKPCIEAQIMDWADDIAYSVHDTEDFYRAGLIPLDRLAVNQKEREHFLARAQHRRGAERIDSEFIAIASEFFNSVNLRDPYDGSRAQRAALYDFTSTTIRDFVLNTKLRKFPGDHEGFGLAIDLDFQRQVEVLKELTWCYVINNPASASVQHGQRLTVRTLFKILMEAAKKKQWAIFPPLYRDEIRELANTHGTTPSAETSRLVADTVAGLTDQQASRLYLRLIGVSQGALFDPIVT